MLLLKLNFTHCGLKCDINIRFNLLFHLLILFPLYLPNEVESKHIHYKLKYIWSALYKHSGREGFMKFWMKFKFAYFLKCENLNSRFMYSIVNNVIDPIENYMLKKC